MTSSDRLEDSKALPLEHRGFDAGPQLLAQPSSPSLKRQVAPPVGPYPNVAGRPSQGLWTGDWNVWIDSTTLRLRCG